MKRYRPKKTPDGWHVWDKIHQAPASGYGVRAYASKEACQAVCDGLTAVWA